MSFKFNPAAGSFKATECKSCLYLGVPACVVHGGHAAPVAGAVTAPVTASARASSVAENPGAILMAALHGGHAAPVAGAVTVAGHVIVSARSGNASEDPGAMLMARANSWETQDSQGTTAATAGTAPVTANVSPTVTAVRVPPANLPPLRLSPGWLAGQPQWPKGCFTPETAAKAREREKNCRMYLIEQERKEKELKRRENEGNSDCTLQ